MSYPISYPITKEQYDYLLPVFGNIGSKKLLMRSNAFGEQYFFIGTHEEHIDMLNRCKYM